MLIAVWGFALFFALRFLGICSISLPAPPETIEIGGDMSTFPEFDIAVRDGAALAVEQARSLRGYPLRFVPYDDSQLGAWSASQGLENAQHIVADPKMLGMVGPLRGPVVKAELPITNKAMLAMVSPTVSEPCLSRPFGTCSLFHYSDPQDAAASLRPTGKNNYFHLAATDELHGPAMARFAYDSLGIRRIAVVDDTYGAFAGDNFVVAFTQMGGTVVARQVFDCCPGGAIPNFRPWLLQAKSAGAEAIYAGGFTINEIGPRVESQGIFDPSSYYLGVDGLPDLFRYGIAEWPDAAAGSPMLNDHVYASRGIGAPYLNPKAAGAIAAFIKLHPDPAENNSQAFAGYDAATILIEAIGRAIDANGGKLPSRQQVVHELSKTKNFHGLTGTYTFTVNGDPATPTLQIEQYRAGAWTPVTNITVATQ